MSDVNEVISQSAGNDQNPEIRPENRDESGRFVPGKSGNPGGRPKKTLLTDAVEEMLDEKLSNPVERERWKNAQWEKMIKSGVVGAMFMEKAWERTEGKVSQPVQVSGELSVSLSDEIRKARQRAEDGAQNRDSE